MKSLIIILLFISSAAFGQVDQVIDRKISDAVQKANDTILSKIVWYTELQITVSRSGSFTLDTITVPVNTSEAFKLMILGDGTAERNVYVTNKNGVYSMRVVNPASYSGPTGTGFNTSAGPSGVIVSMNGNNTVRTYKYGRKNL